MNKHYFEAKDYSAKDLIEADEYAIFTPEMDSTTKLLGTGVDTIKIVKNFMPEQDVNVMMCWLNDMYEIKPATQPDLDKARSTLLQYKEKIKTSAESFFDLKLDYDDYASPPGNADSYLSGRKKDMATAVHTDNLDIDREKYQKYIWSGHVSNLIYLNDNYSGGELFFSHHNLKIKPEPGMLISFPGNWWNRHGILPSSDLRFAISIFLKIKNFG